MNNPIQLIVGLGNPGAEYTDTRHNAGAWFCERLADSLDLKWQREIKFKARTCQFTDQCLLLIPTTYMNLSGQAVGAIAKFYKFSPEQILVVHDELDFAPGVVRLKKGGGAGGHNGLKDIVAHLHSHDFYRLRIGIGHPGNRDLVADYVLNKPSKSDRKLIDHAIENVFPHVTSLIEGNQEKVMRELHTS